MSARSKSKTVRVGLIGYGPEFGMGKHHAGYIAQTDLLETVAVADINPKALRKARQELGEETLTFDSARKMLAADAVDMCVIVTPHNTHARLAIQCLEAGKHVVVEKPMCLSYREAEKMIQAARANDCMLTVFHNRRWDGDYMAIKKAITDGLIGEVFHIEAYMGGWSKPRDWWRSDKQISGGAFYDWGAHCLDCVLGLIPEARMTHITGFFHQDVVWKQMSNEDQVQAIVRFDTGCVADVQMSSVAFAGRAHWRILGTKGTIEDWGGGSFTVYTQVKGYRTEMDVKYQEGQWQEYYRNIAAHLTRGTELAVKPEEAARNIAIMEYAERSSKQGKTLNPPCP
ncbi:MAG: Gfo/Idh/MocA family oxidoreductase [Armatimonadetes bacterium]|nr:Gfo/Idh/MocA family oxidoreductase [Armatimonadota bacterium]